MSAWPEWGEAETEYLERLAEDVPFPDLVQRMQNQAVRNGWPVRGRRGILTRLQRMGYRGRARSGLWTTSGGVAEILGCPTDRVSKWLRNEQIREILQPKRIGRFSYVERRAWRRLAQERPSLLSGYSVDALFLLLEDRELAESVASGCHTGPKDYRIRCIEDGRLWPSATAAAQELHVSRTTITLAIKHRRPVAALGLTFEALRQAS